jgi:2-amino-4-hydroxy-6-hydroxymethyldihydropteridine diphosphokinase
MTRVVLSIGANLGDRLGHLQSVVDEFGSRVRAVSSVYLTAPWGGVARDDFYNAVLIADDPRLDAEDWLRRGRQLEDRAGRVRDMRWGPRTLDVDIVVCDETITDSAELTLPHPLAHRRAFVLVPWLEIDPHARLPLHGRWRPIAELMAELDPEQIRTVRRCNTVGLRPRCSRWTP